MRPPFLAALRAFHATARRGSLSAAAEELAVTPSTVSRQIGTLEEAVGVALVARQGRGIRLTEDGRMLSMDLSDAFDRIDEAVGRIRRPARGERLRITSTPNFASIWLIPRLERFRSQRPGIEVILVDAFDRVGLSGRNEVTIDWGTFRDDATTVAVRLTEGEEMFPVCGPQCCPGPGLAGATLLEADVVGANWSWLDWPTFLAAVGLADPEIGNSLAMNPRLVLEAARQGRGVMLSNTTLARDDLAEGRLVRPVPEFVTVEDSYWMLLRRSERNLPQVAAFVDWLQAELHSWSRENP